MLTVPKKQLYLVLPYMGKVSALVKSGLARSLHKRLPFCKVRIVFKTSNRLRNHFSFKDVVPEPLRSCQIYNLTCGSCNASYTGKIFRYMKVRVSEHQGVLRRVCLLKEISLHLIRISIRISTIIIIRYYRSSRSNRLHPQHKSRKHSSHSFILST